MFTKDFIEGFVKGTLGKVNVCGRWSRDELGNVEVLKYTPSDRPEDCDIVAYKLPDGSSLSNANVLEYVGRRFAWGSEIRWRGGETDEQRWLQRAGAAPLPFTLFSEVPEVDVRKFKWILKPIAEKVTLVEPKRGDFDKSSDISRTRTQHFTGACLFSLGEDAYLFDIDRQEIEMHGIFNPFLTKLPKCVETIEEAYDILIPNEVRKALADGIEVKRQGEFFFVKHSDESPIKPDLTDEEWKILRSPPSRIGYGLKSYDQFDYVKDDHFPFEKKVKLDTPEKQEFQKAALVYADVFKKYRDSTHQEGTLGKSATGSHSVEKYFKIGNDIFASGTIKQNRRQHGDLLLKGWYKVYANTGTISWTITGKID